MRGKQLILKNMNEIIVYRELNQHDEDMLSKEISNSDTCCVYLKETNDAQKTSMQKCL